MDINGLLDREKIYGYDDDTERFIAFQIAFCDWMSKWQHNPDIIHCHDHHTGLIPFMIRHCFAFRNKRALHPNCFYRTQWSIPGLDRVGTGIILFLLTIAGTGVFLTGTIRSTRWHQRSNVHGK
ncbi:MAG: glycogen/starch synthase [Bacteroidota bacterium]